MESRDTFLRKIGGSLTLAVPPNIVRAYDLARGDFIRWNFDGNEVRVQLFKLSENIAPAERVQETTHAHQGSNNEL